ncbi:MAG: shikimate dehydrogenase [Candidatus Omnitrophica bacterium]|nr:shikimate dehydrogenase [Candidatus Omnitrophota bacterium]
MPDPLLYGLIGYPVGHSLSPGMHNAAFQALGIDAEYRLFEVSPAQLESFMMSLDTRDIRGFNVTVPHKEAVIGCLDLADEELSPRGVKAVNTVVKRGERWKGFNTDIPGFLRHIREHIDPAGKRVALLGAGGAGKAVASALAAGNASRIVICDLEVRKLSETLEMIRQGLSYNAIFGVDSIEGLELADKDILINATPVGLKESDPCLIEREDLHQGLFVYDLIYNPPETKLLISAREAGLRCANGLGMLLYQGALAFEHFTGRQAPVEVMRKALESAIQGQ